MVGPHSARPRPRHHGLDARQGIARFPRCGLVPTPTPQVDSIEDWLTSIGLEQYVGLLVRNEVDLSTLRILTDDDLKELGLPFGPRKRLLAALQADKSLGTAGAAAAQEGQPRHPPRLFVDPLRLPQLAHPV